MKLHTLDRIFAIFLFAFGVYIVATATTYGYMQGSTPGPGFFPFLVGLLIAGLSIINFVRSLSGREQLNDKLELAGILKSAAIAVVLVVFVLTSDFLGMVVACAVLVLAVAWIIRPRWDKVFLMKIVATAILFPIIGYLMFGVYLNVPLPEGLLAF